MSKKTSRQAAILTVLVVAAAMLVSLRYEQHKAMNEQPVTESAPAQQESIVEVIVIEPQEEAAKADEALPEAAPLLQTLPLEREPAFEVVTVYNVPLDKELQLFIVELCEAKNIDPAVVFAMIEHESRYDADIMGDSGHAYGLMQIQRRFHLSRMEKLGVTDLLDPYQNVTVGIDYLSWCIEYNGGNVEMGLVSYNAGQYGAEQGWFNHGIYSSDYSRTVLATAETIAEGAVADVYS